MIKGVISDKQVSELLKKMCPALFELNNVDDNNDQYQFENEVLEFDKHTLVSPEPYRNSLLETPTIQQSELKHHTVSDLLQRLR